MVSYEVLWNNNYKRTIVVGSLNKRYCFGKKNFGLFRIPNVCNFFISALAELEPPFDLPEAEAELWRISKIFWNDVCYVWLEDM